MIIKELYELYERLEKEGVDLPQRGWSRQKVSFRIVLESDGTLVRIEDARRVVQVTKGKKTSQQTVMSEMMVPGNTKPSGSGINPCFLWDNLAYLLGCTDVKPRAVEYFTGLKEKHLVYEKELHSVAYSAVCRFLEMWDPERCKDVFSENGLDIKDFAAGNGVFRLRGSGKDVHEESEIREWWNTEGAQKWQGKSQDNTEGFCLITGKVAPIARLHEPAIKGVSNAQITGAKIVSYNCSSFTSYGKEDGENAPVSEKAAHEYACALNYLLSQDLQRTHIGDATVVFWTDAPKEKAEKYNYFAAAGMDPSRFANRAQDSALVQSVREWLKKVAGGKMPGTDEEINEWQNTRFFILGLSPNSSRLSIRFFYESTLAEWMEHLTSHFAALQLVRRPKFNDPEVITPYMILCETAREAKEIAPLAAGALMRSILTGLPYPDSIATSIMRRMRIDGYVNYVRCAFLKAWLTRKKTPYNLQLMLDENNTQPGYLLGRLFAVLVKTQKDVAPDLNRTIQDAYYGSASASPGSVFPRLLRLHKHHLSNLEVPIRMWYDKLEQNICGKINAFPAHLNTEQQGLFALGCYHQTQALYSKTTSNPTDTDNEQN